MCTSGKKLLRKYLRSVLGIRRNEKITHNMLKYGKKKFFTNKDAGKSWIEIMNENDDELPPYDFVV